MQRYKLMENKIIIVDSVALQRTTSTWKRFFGVCEW